MHDDDIKDDETKDIPEDALPEAVADEEEDLDIGDVLDEEEEEEEGFDEDEMV
jgi:hypothetical protein